MRWRPLTWLLLSIACFIGALYFWRLGDERAASKSVHATNPGVRSLDSLAGQTSIRSSSSDPLVRLASASAGTNRPSASMKSRTDRFRYRFTNTTKTIGQLARSDDAILLENALIDGSKPVDFVIPGKLQAKGDPGSYIVQARGLTDKNFRTSIQQAGAAIVAYVPNNAYLVRASSGVVAQLSSNPRVLKVYPYQPYYKLSMPLLRGTMENIPFHGDLNVLVFNGANDSELADLQKAGSILSQQPSPFGTEVTIADADPVALASLSGIQRVELAPARELDNDITRVRLNVSSDLFAQTNYMGLTGSNIVVQVNDSGVDAIHPDLVNRVFSTIPSSLVDFNGHGTHVAGTIAGSGFESQTVSNAIGSLFPTSTNGLYAPGQFRGMATNAQIISLPLALGDFALQENAARSNVFVSNNSWGYVNDNAYDIAAASYDAAVRDAIPEVSGSQPVTFVFSAGNSGGNGSSSGSGGNPDTITSPGTAKNVITVGAVENFRDITNNRHMTVNGTVQTDQPWLNITDSSNQIAGFSSRGNVGEGLEGDFGRFKPDVVAPGTMIVSDRSTKWDTNSYYSDTNSTTTPFNNVILNTNIIADAEIFTSPNTIQVAISVFGTEPPIDMPIYVKHTGFPTLTNYDFVKLNNVFIPPDAQLTYQDDTWFFGVGNISTQRVSCNVAYTVTVTNDMGDYFDVYRTNLNEHLGLFYRYESGTSMSAASISGVTALIGEFFTNNWNQFHIRPSPALVKALLINGARSLLDGGYDFQVNSAINYQGWGMVDIINSLPMGLVTNGSAPTSMPMFFFDQDPTNALATGQSQTRFFSVAPDAVNAPLRVTLVWTDPPGNPAVGIKLVNDLDLIVTNLETGDVFFGNDFEANNTFTLAWDTNSPPNRDIVNNVENVYLDSPLGTNFSVTVLAHRVNVNAVTTNTTDVVQDYALVVSSADGQFSDALALTPGPVVSQPMLNLTVVTNDFTDQTNIAGQLLLQQRLGASSPLLSTNTIPLGNQPNWAGNGAITLGTSNQWHFYVMTNETDFNFAVFSTFLPPNLSPTRMGVTNQNSVDQGRLEADIDLYVSTNSALLSLDPAAVAGADKSLTRGGTEMIVLSNAFDPSFRKVFYIGVKSEDQQSAEFGFLGLFSQFPPNTGDSNGNVYVTFVPVPQNIPDAKLTPAGTIKPGAAVAIGPVYMPVIVRRAIVTNGLAHDLIGDLQTPLKHNGISDVLNNHTCAQDQFFNCYTNFIYIYEDNGEGDIPGAKRSDGPGSLKSFAGEDGVGAWTYEAIDTVVTHTGHVASLSMKLEPAMSDNGILLTIQPGQFAFDVVDVPPEATNLNITISGNTGDIILFVRKGDFPSLTTFDYTNVFNPPGGSFSIGATNFPPLSPGRYFLGFYNPPINGPQTIRVFITLGLSFAPVSTINYSSHGPVPITDDGVSFSTISLTNLSSNLQVVRAAIAVAITHPRVSDLVLTLIDPAGERFVLMENRGGPSAANIGGFQTQTNFLGTQTSGDLNQNVNVISPVPPSGTLVVNYNFFQEPDTMDVFYGSQDIFSSGFTSGSGLFSIPFGFNLAPDLTIVMNKGGNTNNPTTLWNYTPAIITERFSYLTFTDNTNFSQVPIKFAVPPFAGVSNVTTTNLISSFEAPVPMGTYNSSSIVDGWIVAANSVLVTNSPPGGANGSSQYLRLMDGTIVRTLPTRAGNTYTLSFWYWGRGSATVSVAGTGSTNIVGKPIWQKITIPVGARVLATPLQIVSTGSGLLLDEFSLAETGDGNLYYYPEEPLKRLVGESPTGDWTLEVRDARAGAVATSPSPQIISWQMQFIFDTNISGAFGLPEGQNVTNTIPPCAIATYAIDVPPEAAWATNTIVTSTGPVNMWFNQTNVPTGVTPPDFELLTNTTGGSATLSLTSSIPPLVPGSRYYIGIQNPCDSTSNVTYVFRYDFGVNIVTLTNMVPYHWTNSNTAPLTNDYYHFIVPPEAVRAQFEIDNPSADVTLVVNKGLPLPTIDNFQLISANPGLSTELITLFPNSTPVPLTPGNWYLTAVNVSGVPVSYDIKASWWTNSGLPITIIDEFFSTTNSFCITWTSLPGVHYYIQGSTTLGPVPDWTTLVPDIIGAPYPATTTTWCVPLPTPYHYFRVLEGIAPPAATMPILSIQRVGGNNLIQWTGPTTASYQVQWSSSLSQIWISVPGLITSNTGQFSFLDDGTLTGGLYWPRFYRVLLFP